jgi:hypothetical protein
MAGSKSNYLECKMLDHVLGGGDYSRPATVYVALFNVLPAADTDRDSGTGYTEVGGGSYARKSVTNNATNWPAATAGAPSTKTNGTAVSFVTPTDTWGTVVGFAIFDASTAGNMLYHGTLSSPRTIASGDPVQFAAGAIVITED